MNSGNSVDLSFSFNVSEDWMPYKIDIFPNIVGPEKETKYVILGEKAKAQLIRDSKKDIELSITELQKNPLNYTQVGV